MEQEGWWETEVNNAEFGDQRLSIRLVHLAKAMASQPSASIPQANQDWATTKAAYRFFDNAKVSSEKILEPHQRQTVLRANQQSVILAVQDSTTFNFGERSSETGLGAIKLRADKALGFHLHTTLAMTSEGLPLGILQFNTWSRTEEHMQKLKDEKRRESFRWEESVINCRDLLSSDTKIVHIGDRESDIFDLYQTAEKLGQFFCIRARAHRTIEHKDTRYQYLLELLWDTPAQGSITIDLPKKKESKTYKEATRSSRKVEVLISFVKVTLKSKARGRKVAETIDCYAVYAVEKDPPPLGEDRIEWVLATNIPVLTIEDAIERVNWYKKRWEIELFHKILKSGCRVEMRKLEHYDRLVNFIALMSIIAWRILWMSYLNRLFPENSCLSMLKDHEWKALYCKIHKTHLLPKTEPQVRDVVLWIARLGGFLARKGDGNPGPTVIWRGWQRLSEIAEDYLIFNPQIQRPPAIYG